MRNLSIGFIVLVLVVCFALNPFPIDAQNEYPHAKGEMRTIYDCEHSWALNPRISGDKLFFMTKMNNNFDPRISNCFIYDMENEEYSIIHSTEPDTSIAGGYSWKACINEDYVFWQLWHRNPETDERTVYGNLTNLETMENERFEFPTLDPRIGIGSDGLYVFDRSIENAYITLFEYDLRKPGEEKKRIDNGINHLSAQTPVASGSRIAFIRDGEVYIYDSESEETIQVTDEDNRSYFFKYSLQGDYFFYFSSETEVSCFDVITRERKVVFTHKRENVRDVVRLIVNPNSDYLLLDVTKAKSDICADGNFENYLFLYDPIRDKSKKIFVSDTYELMGIYGLTSTNRRLSDGKKVVYKKPGEYGCIYVYDGDKDSISRIDIDRKYRWHIDDYNIYGNTIVWAERFHGKRPDGSYPQRLKIFRLSD